MYSHLCMKYTQMWCCGCCSDERRRIRAGG